MLFGERLVLSNRFHGECFLVKGVFCQTVFLENVCGESERLVLSNRFHGKCFLVNSCFVKPFSWRMLFGERFVCQTVFMENAFW